MSVELLQTDSDSSVSISSFLTELTPDIVSIQEIEMNKGQANLFPRFDGFSTYYKPRKGNPEHGGGVAVIIRDTISHVIISELGKETGQIGVKIKINIHYYNFISLYSPVNTLKCEIF